MKKAAAVLLTACLLGCLAGCSINEEERITSKDIKSKKEVSSENIASGSSAAVADAFFLL